MSKLRQVLKLYFMGMGTKSISNTTGVSRNTVKKYLVQARYIKLTAETSMSLSDHELNDLFRNDVVMPMPETDRVKVLFSFFDNEGKQLRRRGITLLHLWYEYLHNILMVFSKHHITNIMAYGKNEQNPLCIWSTNQVTKCSLILRVRNFE